MRWPQHTDLSLTLDKNQFNVSNEIVSAIFISRERKHSCIGTVSGTTLSWEVRWMRWMPPLQSYQLTSEISPNSAITPTEKSVPVLLEKKIYRLPCSFVLPYVVATLLFIFRIP